MSKYILRVTGFVAAVALSACVGSDVERAGVGAVVGGLAAKGLDGNVAGGILVGAAAGALADDVAGF